MYEYIQLNGIVHLVLAHKNVLFLTLNVDI